MEWRLCRVQSIDRLPGVKYVVAEKLEGSAVKLVCPRRGRHGHLSASRSSCLCRCQHRVDAKLLNGIERNRQSNVRLLSLIDDVCGVDPIVGKVVVVTSPAGKSNRALVTSSGIDRAWRQGCEGRPVAPIQRQFFYLFLLDPGAQRT